MELDPASRDLLIRTVVGEAANQPPEGQAGVAYSVLNRLNSGKYGNSIPKIILAPNAYEPWQTRSTELQNISPDSKAYQKAAAIVDGVASGDIPDPSNGATHFLNEDIVRQRRGGTLPSWAQGQGIQIGAHTFFSPDQGNGIDAINRAANIPNRTGGQAMAFNGPDYLGSYLKTADDPTQAPTSRTPQATAKQAPPVKDYLGAYMGTAENAAPAAPASMPPQDAYSIPIPAPVPDAPGYKPPPPSQGVSEFTERTLKPLANLPEGVATVASDYLHRLAQLGGQQIETVGSGVRDIQAGMPATGVGKIGLGALGYLGSLAQATDVPITKMTGNPDFGEKVPMVFGGAGGGYVANAMRPTVSALKDVITDIGAENLPQVIKRLESNPNLTLMDVSPTVQGNAAGLATDPRNAAAMNFLNNFQKDRMAQRGPATINAFEDVLGPTPNAKTIQDNIAAKAQQTGKNLIEPAIASAKPVDVTGVVNNIDNQFPAAMLNQLKDTGTFNGPMSDKLTRLWELRQRIRGDWDDRERMFMDADQAHELQKELRLESGDPTIGFQARDVRRGLVNAIDQATAPDGGTVGTYKPALKQYADDKAIGDAFKKGFDLFANPTSADSSLANHPDMWNAWAQDASDAEKEAVKNGAMLGARSRIVNMRQGTNIPEGSFAHDRLAAVVGQPQADKVVSTLNDWRDISQTDNLLTKNSATAVRQAGQDARAVPSTTQAPGAWQKYMAPAIAAGSTFQTTANPLLAGAAAISSAALGKTARVLGKMHAVASNSAYAEWAAATGQKREVLLNILSNAAAKSNQTGTAQKLLNLAPPSLVSALPR